MSVCWGRPLKRRHPEKARSADGASGGVRDLGPAAIGAIDAEQPDRATAELWVSLRTRVVRQAGAELPDQRSTSNKTVGSSKEDRGDVAVDRVPRAV